MQMTNALVLTAVLLLAGCTSNTPIVDMKGVNTAQYEKDLAECRAYADKVETGKQAARGATRGAMFGGLLGAIFGNSDTAKRGAGAGAVTGGAKGAVRADRRKERVVFNCLRGRGYRVLG